ncbi:phage protein [Weissella oryzae SG25]|uniref:Phage protein n=1 Tax=Weissella oryzae (strain DSM 25784 / JCM 18191 / LMG 30913 / SG25) TaxID=1329250 RepID=A0A069CSJ0_WEIOS|nr:HK97 family phage prohead protease [Weissella oryzae]GAK30213.1 phage protein [Weissella oryzae SG25]
MNELDERVIHFKDLEIRDGTETNDFVGQIAGYAIAFNSPSVSAGPFIEYIDKTALNGVDLSNVLALYDHDYSNVLGRVTAGTLKLKVDAKGLYFELDVPNTTLGNDIYKQIKLGNLQGVSFGFSVDDGGDSWSYQDGKPVRAVEQIASLKEISVVSVPAYEATTVQATRSLNDWQKNNNYKEKVAVYMKGFNNDND